MAIDEPIRPANTLQAARRLSLLLLLLGGPSAFLVWVVWHVASLAVSPSPPAPSVYA
jgi:hypothetical protein